MGLISDVGGSGVGSEVLRRTYVDGSGESEVTLCTGVTNHIMTILTIIVCSMGGPADAKFIMYLDYDLGGSNLELLRNVPVGTDETFVWNDRIVITDQDKLHLAGSSVSGTAMFDIHVSYIDQEFTT